MTYRHNPFVHEIGGEEANSLFVRNRERKKNLEPQSRGNGSLFSINNFSDWNHISRSIRRQNIRRTGFSQPISRLKFSPPMLILGDLTWMWCFADIIEAVKQGPSDSSPTRPNLIKLVSTKPPYDKLKTLVARCWAESPRSRPSIDEVKSSFRKTAGRAGRLVDHLLRHMERYADELEEMVATKTAELMEEKQKIQTILFELLPK